ncbi:rhomboid family intramembrane serine protease [Ulvibacterium sp.]|uniref:rhomboid family intramembrane serine protease n=1 Tax=Ulvibacterium sp. TaxID=2665914 RepID=UPI0026276BF3|nr:rhomboid family intramembrane serine protease [Ulvibacterium sp.]
MNWTLIGLNIIIFFLVAGIDMEKLQLLILYFGIVPENFRVLLIHGMTENLGLAGLTLITSQFLHGGLGHLIGNMWTLYIFGDNVEERMGSWGYLIFYLLCGVIAGLTHVFINPDSAVPTIGASGAISGVMGAYLFLFPKSKVVFLIPWFVPIVFIPSIFYLALWFLGQSLGGSWQVLTSETGGVAFWAHIGGFIGGILIHWIFVLGNRLRTKVKF